jgi:hypothetical protein
MLFARFDMVARSGDHRFQERLPSAGASAMTDPSARQRLTKQGRIRRTKADDLAALDRAVGRLDAPKPDGNRGRVVEAKAAPTRKARGDDEENGDDPQECKRASHPTLTVVHADFAT